MTTLIVLIIAGIALTIFVPLLFPVDVVKNRFTFGPARRIPGAVPPRPELAWPTGKTEGQGEVAMTPQELKQAAKQFGEQIDKNTPDGVGYVVVLHDFRASNGPGTAISSNFSTEEIPDVLELTEMDTITGSAQVSQAGKKGQKEVDR